MTRNLRFPQHGLRKIGSVKYRNRSTLRRRFCVNFVRHLDHKVIRFLLSGGLNTLFGYSIYAALLYLDVPYLTALFLATVSGIIFNYFSFNQFVFRINTTWSVFGKFVIAYGGTYVVNAILLAMLNKVFLLNFYWGQIICIPFCVCISWLLMHCWVYKKDRSYVAEETN